MGLTLGAARGLALEVAVVQKMLDELEDDGDAGGAAPAEVVAPERELVPWFSVQSLVAQVLLC